MEYHELSRYFPMLPEDEFKYLVSSIERFGQLEKITLLDGKILDGRNRYEACVKLGIEPEYREYGSDGHEPLEFVVAANMRRRHLTEAQKAQIIIDIEGKPEPMPRKKSGSLGQGIAPTTDDPPSYSELARKAGVSDMTVARVAEVQDSPTLVAELREGKTSARDAQLEHRARKGMKVTASTKVKQAKYAGLDKVKWILDYIASWTRKIDDFIDAAKEGKFSPEAKRFTIRKVKILARKIEVLMEVLGDDAG